MTKRVSYVAVSTQADSVFSGAFVKRTDRGDHESANLRLPFAVVRVTETEKEKDGKVSRSVRKDAVAFAISESVANNIVGALNGYVFA